jgi:hypothetical protein
MTSKSKFRISPALVIGCIALFVALGGSALAVGVGKNTVRSPQIVDGTVRAVDLHDQAVAAGKIAENAVESAQVAPDSLTTEDLGDNSVGSREIQAGAIRSSELGPIIQVSNSTGIAAGANGGVTATCPAGTTVISGGAQPANFGVEMTSSLRSGNGWLYQAKNNNGSTSTLTAFAYCLTGGSSN